MNILERLIFYRLLRKGSTRMLMICHCEKQLENVLRIISVRKATKNERKFYHG